MPICKKRAFQTKTEAKRTLGRVQSIRDNGTQIKRVYRCGRCGYWHLSSQPKTVVR